MTLDIMLLLHHYVVRLLTAHNPARLSYAFYCMLVFLGTSRILRLYIFPVICIHHVVNTLDLPLI